MQIFRRIMTTEAKCWLNLAKYYQNFNNLGNFDGMKGICHQIRDFPPQFENSMYLKIEEEALKINRVNSDYTYLWPLNAKGCQKRLSFCLKSAKECNEIMT